MSGGVKLSSHRELIVIATAVASMLVGGSSLRAEILLLGGDFEPIGGEILGWELSESIYDQTTMTDRDFGTVNTAQQQNFDPQEGPFALWLRPFAGGQDPGPDNLTNAVLSQSVPAVAGKEYNLSGWSRFEANYAGGVSTLDAGSPLGAAASPTVSEFQMEFLDGNGAVLGAPLTIDVKADRIGQTPFPEFELANDNAWYEHNLTGTAPEGTMQLRVSASDRQMVFNLNPAQSAFYDSFALSTTGQPEVDLLTNGGIDEEAASGLNFWLIETEDPGNEENEQIIRTAGFANHTPGGAEGVWLSSFFGEEGTEVDGKISQTVAAEVGGMYSFTGWSLFEANYTAELTFMELAFLDGGDNVIGDSVFLDLSTEQSNGAGWAQHTLQGVAPEGAVNVRVAAGMENGVNPGSNPQSAFFDDFVLELELTATPGDFDDDGDVDGADMIEWQRDPTVGSLADWEANFGATPTGATTAQVPEPSCLVLLVLGAAVVGYCYRK